MEKSENGTSGLGSEIDEQNEDEILRDLLLTPQTWGTRELHVEIETYTWDVMPSDVAGGSSASDVVDGLVREYDHVLETFEACGWDRVRGAVTG